MDYKMMIPPYEIGDFHELTKKQAEEHFKWYVQEIPYRLAQLEEYADMKKKANLTFNKEPSSLIPIWEWFEGIIMTEEKTDDELKKELELYPFWLRNKIIENNMKFTYETLSVGMDLAIYFAETFIKNNPSVQWGYFTKPKNRASVNKPVLLGFIGDQALDPREIVLNSMRKSLRERKSDILYSLYNTWVKEIKN